MITEQQEELAALYALELLEGAEKADFESQLKGNDELSALVDGLIETAALAFLSAPQIDPPADLKKRILAIAAESVPKTKVVRFPSLKLVPWALVAGIAAAALWLGYQNYLLRTENVNLQTDRQLAEIAHKIAQSQLSERSLLAEGMINDLGRKLRRTEDLARLKVTALVSLAGNTRQAEAIAVWDPDRQCGLLTMEKLSPIGAGQDYQIWVVDPAYKDPVNGGVFHVSHDGKIAVPFKADKPITQPAAFAVSLERKGGVARADGTIVLLGR